MALVKFLDSLSDLNITGSVRFDLFEIIRETKLHFSDFYMVCEILVSWTTHELFANDKAAKEVHEMYYNKLVEAGFYFDLSFQEIYATIYFKKLEQVVNDDYIVFLNELAKQYDKFEFHIDTEISEDKKKSNWSQWVDLKTKAIELGDTNSEKELNLVLLSVIEFAEYGQSMTSNSDAGLLLETYYKSLLEHPKISKHYLVVDYFDGLQEVHNEVHS